MEWLQGKVIKGTTPLTGDIEVWLARGKSGPNDWSGSFELPAGAHVDEGGSYRLELEDGRAGTFTVTNVGGDDSEPHRVGFRGASPLA